MLSIDDLEGELGNPAIDNQSKEVITIFLTAINDWPSPILTIEDYGLEVEKFVKGFVTKRKIEEALNDIDFSTEAWPSESLVQLLEVFQFYENDILLKTIISDLITKLRK